MRNEPHATALLQVARTTLLEEIVPAVPEAQRYALRMVANAIAIAARELEAGRNAASGSEDDAALAEAIRAGRIPLDTTLHERLRAAVAERLALSNPRVLEGKRR